MTWRRGRRRGKHSAPGLKTRVSGAKFPVDLPVCVRKGVTHTKVFRLEKPVKTVFQPPGLSASEGKCFAALGAVLFGIVCTHTGKMNRKTGGSETQWQERNTCILLVGRTSRSL